MPLPVRGGVPWRWSHGGDVFSMGMGVPTVGFAFFTVVVNAGRPPQLHRVTCWQEARAPSFS